MVVLLGSLSVVFAFALAVALPALLRLRLWSFAHCSGFGCGGSGRSFRLTVSETSSKLNA